MRWLLYFRIIMCDTWLSLGLVFGLWVAGFLCGYGIRGLTFACAKRKVVDDLLEAIRQKAAKEKFVITVANDLD